MEGINEAMTGGALPRAEQIGTGVLGESEGVFTESQFQVGDWSRGQGRYEAIVMGNVHRYRHHVTMVTITGILKKENTIKQSVLTCF